MLSVRSRAALGALRRAAPGTRRNLSQLTMGFDEIARWKEEKRIQQANRDRKPTVYDIKIHAPSHLSNNWNISRPEVAAPRRPRAMSSAVTSETPESERRSLISRFVAQLKTNPPAPLVPPMPAAPALPSVPETATNDYTLPYDPIFSGPRCASQINEVPCLSVLHKIVSGTPQTAELAVPVLPVTLVLNQANAKDTDKKDNNKRPPPRNPEDLKLKESGPEDTEDRWKGFRAELPMFLGGGPFV